MSSRELEALENEMGVLAGLRHANIVRYLGTDRTGDGEYCNSSRGQLVAYGDLAVAAAAAAGTLSIFLEYVPGGSIRSLLDRFGPLQVSSGKNIAS